MFKAARRAAAFVCLLALLLGLPGPVSAAGTVYFTAVNETVLDLSDSTMPAWSGGVLYVPHSVFDGSNAAGVNFNIYYSYNRDTGLATLFNTRQFLTFDLNSGVCYDGLTGEYLSGRAILRNGLVYVPVALVCRFFGLTYSVIPITEGYMVRVKNGAVVLSDAAFVDAATNSIAHKLREYNQANQSAPTPGVRPPSVSQEPEEPEPAPQEPEEPDRISIYLGFRCGDGQGLSAILDVLDAEGLSAAFFFSPEVLMEHEPLLYRILGSGHSVGLLAEGDSAAAVRNRLEQGLRALERTAYTRTALALVPAEFRSALEEEGWVCWEETAAVPEPGVSSAAYAGQILRQLSGSRNACLTLDGGAESARVLSTLLQRLEARSYTITIPLETNL